MSGPDRPLRICFAAYRGNMACGGQGIYLWYLARELARLGHQVDVVVGPPYPAAMPFAGRVTRLPNRELWGMWFTRDYGKLHPARNDGRLPSPLEMYELGASRLGFLPEPFAFSLRAFRALAGQAAGGRRWDVVHDVQCLGWGLLGVRALGLPVVTTVHHPLTVDRRASFVRDESFRDAIGTMTFYPIGMQSFVARHVDRVLTSSEESARRIAADFGVAPERLRNVHNGIDTDLFRPAPDAARDPDEILCVGRARDPNKGIRTLLRALARLPAPARLTLVDDDNPRGEVFGWARELGVGDRLHVTGRLSEAELVSAYRRAGVVAVPSRYEGFGLPAVEAMGCGAPVVASRAGALPEVLKLAPGGLLVERDDPDELAAGLGALLRDPERRRELGAGGRAGVERHFSWSAVARRTAAVYAEVLRGLPASTTTSARLGA